MFGYIKPFVPDLRVREHELYRAVYCGLCRSMGRHTGCLSRLTLSYDFTFLCAVRLILEKQKYNVNICHCAASPLKPRPIMDDNPVLAYCSAVAALLTRAKVQDDINDSKGTERFKSRILMPSANSIAKKALKYDPSLPTEDIDSYLKKLSSLEKGNCPSLDQTADCFGNLLSCIFSHGLEKREASIASSIGFSIGRLIYVLDAADDREKDLEKGNYNPLNIEPISNESLMCAVKLELTKVEAAVNLFDNDTPPELSEIIYNIIYEGLPKEAEKVFCKAACPKKGSKKK